MCGDRATLAPYDRTEYIIRASFGNLPVHFFKELRMDAVRKSLDEAITGLQKVLADPKVKIEDAIAANDLLKSLRRFRAKI